MCNWWRRFWSRYVQHWIQQFPDLETLLATGFLILLPLFIILYVKSVEEENNFYSVWRPWYERDLPGLDDKTDIPRILLWSMPSLEWETDDPLPPRGELKLQSCQVRDNPKNCVVTRERARLKWTDAVLFDANYITFDNPTVRHQDQVWVIRTRGDPPRQLSYAQALASALFNWTMSYRRDADVTVPYRKWAPPPMKFSNEGLNQVIHRKKSVAVWLVSECEAERITEDAGFTGDEIRNDFEYARFFASATGAKIIYSCGGEACRNRHECLKSFEDTYFFLFVVESSPCFEHPHHLLFDALQYSLVPIYFGSSALGNTVPPSSVIDATSAAFAEDVLGLVVNILSNTKLYHNYMEWKDRYNISAPINDLCVVCDALYEKRNRTTKGSIFDWWKRGPECKDLPTDRVYALIARV